VDHGVEVGRVALAALAALEPAGVDLMKPFRPKFTDKTQFGQI
jgi:hypothetical protein